MAKKGKKYRQAAELIEANKEYNLEEAAELLKKTATTKFDASIDMDIRLGVDPRHADQMVRGTVSLPHG
jgi:large subunit ribosomal protein L1